jgi:hypothetical protein
MYGLKPVPFKLTRLMYGLKPVPFKLTRYQPRIRLAAGSTINEC